MKEQLAGTFLSDGSMAYVEALYEDYIQDPQSVSESWRAQFDALTQGLKSTDEPVRTAVRDHYARLGAQWPSRGVTVEAASENPKQYSVYALIDAYRMHGHLLAKIDPLDQPRTSSSVLDLDYYGLTEADLGGQFDAKRLMGPGKHALRDIIQALEGIYCGAVGVEYAYLSNAEEVDWLRGALESKDTHGFDTAQRTELLASLVDAEGMEQYLGRKYVGQKRFSLEGGESIIPMMREILKTAALDGVDEAMLSMAHRGRLNVLFNIMGMPADELCTRFEGTLDHGLTSGDVKYHLGYSSDCEIAGQPMHLALAYNPSHLEAIVPIAMGSARARQDQRADHNPTKVLNISLHGDASLAGLGVIQETLNMAGPPAYNVQGTVHLVVNNQIGFTLSDPAEARTGEYCTNIARSIDAPIFHVNGDDPEACVRVAQLATQYRARFHKDVFIDMLCFRKLGHNEADEPIATNPEMYNKVRKHPGVCTLYAQALDAAGVVSAEAFNQMKTDFTQLMDAGKASIAVTRNGLTEKRSKVWDAYIGREWREAYASKLPLKTLKALAEKACVLPEGFDLQKQVKTLMGQRVEMAAGTRPLNWGFAETLAYATLMDNGHSVRLVGEDSQRGTFAHRHAVVHDQTSFESFAPLSNFQSETTRLTVYNSVLCEFAALGFEYGYACSAPNDLVIWEAQFGDFANGGQVVIDQFISSAWQKWKRLSGLVMLLPHGYEGMGPEHSSARLERFLQMCAQGNMQVCVPTTPAQIYHLLRRQALRAYRRPLIVMTPKSLLRHPLATSSLEDLADGDFQVLIGDETVQAAKAKRVIITSGKVYYDLVQKRDADNIHDTAIIRIEQLYPFPDVEFEKLLKPYQHVKEIVWCQEEPMNQGAWYTSQHNIRGALLDGQRLRYAGREASAAPAAGYPALHKLQQEALVLDALGLTNKK